MAYALVGTIGAASQGASGAAVTPAWGTSENRTANNLLICFVSVTAVATLPTTPSGWSIGKQIAGTSCSATIYYKIAAGTDSAPTIAAITSGVISAQLAEFSGNATSSPVNQTGSATGTSSPITATQAAVDSYSGELLLMAGADFRSTARSPNDTWTSNSGTVTQAGSNNGVSSVNHYSFGYILSTTQNASADTAIMTLSVTTNITGLAVASASFKLTPVSPVAVSGIVTWWKADSLSLSDGTAISAWTDSSLIGNSLAQATGTQQPIYKTNIQNALPIVRFDGSNDEMRTGADIGVSQPFTVFTVGKQNNTSTSGRYIDVVSGSRSLFGLKETTGFSDMYSGTANINDSTDHTAAWHYMAGIFNGASSAHYIDGSQVATGNPGSNGLGTIVVGSDGSSPFSYFNGDIGEILIYGGALSTTDRATVENYLQRWFPAARLPNFVMQPLQPPRYR